MSLASWAWMKARCSRLMTLDLRSANDRLLRRLLYLAYNAGDPWVFSPEHFGMTYEEVAEILRPLQLRDAWGVELRVGEPVVTNDPPPHPGILVGVEDIGVGVRVRWEGDSFDQTMNPADISIVGGG